MRNRLPTNQRLEDSLGRFLTAGDAIGNPDPRIRVARQRETGVLAGSFFNASHALKMADVILRHGTVMPGNDGKTRFAAHSENLTQLGPGNFDQLIVGVSQDLRLQRPA